MSYTIIRPKDREEWLRYRESGIGSSEVGTILGLNPFETPYQLWRRKKGMDAPKEENFAMRAGHYLEDAVSKFYADETGRQIIKRSAGEWLIIDNERPYLRVSPDRTMWLTESRANDSKGILECKTTQREIDADNVPAHWFVQLQYQLGVGRMKEGALAWLTMGRSFGYLNIAFDQECYDWITTEITEFWERYIAGDEEPNAYNADDTLLHYPRHREGKSVAADETVLAKLKELKEAKRLEAEAAAEKKAIEGELKMLMGDAEFLIEPRKDLVLATWKTNKDSQVFDTERFKKEHPETFAAYLKTRKGARVFNIKAV